MQAVLTAAYKTSARLYQRDLSIAPLASQGLPFLRFLVPVVKGSDRDVARLVAGLMPPMTGCCWRGETAQWGRRERDSNPRTFRSAVFKSPSGSSGAFAPIRRP